MEANEPTTSGEASMTAAQAARLATYANVRHAMNMCATAIVSDLDPNCFGVRVHLRGGRQCVHVWKYSRQAINDAADSLYIFAFPDVPS